MLDIAGLANAAINQIHECLEDGDWLPSPGDITFIYTKSGENKNLRELVVTELVNAFLEKTSDGFVRESEAWSEVLSAQLLFSCEVMDDIKRHTDLIECDRRVPCRFHFTHRPSRKRKRTIRWVSEAKQGDLGVELLKIRMYCVAENCSPRKQISVIWMPVVRYCSVTLGDLAWKIISSAPCPKPRLSV